MNENCLLAIMGKENGCEVFCTTKDYEIKSYKVNKSIKQVLKSIANDHFVSFEGTLKMMSKKYGIVQKVPLLIKKDQMLFFSTTSLDQDDCIVLNYYCVDSFKTKGKDTQIRFCVPVGKHTISLDFNMLIQFDRRTIKNQIERCKVIDNDLKEVKELF